MIRKISLTALLLLLVFVLFVAGCGGGSTPVPIPGANATQPVSKSPVAWKSEGVIAANEYTAYQKIGDLDVFTRVDGDSVLFGIKAATTGYLALGLDPGERMKDADILMCYMKDTGAAVAEMYSNGPTGPHPLKAGATAAVTEVSGSYKDGVAVFEFRRKMKPEDGISKALKIGENKVIWAFGSDWDISKKHSRRGTATLLLQ